MKKKKILLDFLYNQNCTVVLLAKYTLTHNVLNFRSEIVTNCLKINNVNPYNLGAGFVLICVDTASYFEKYGTVFAHFKE